MKSEYSDPDSNEIIRQFLGICYQNQYPERTNIIVPGDAAESLYYVISGSLSITMQGEDKRNYVLAYLSPGDFIGETGLFITSHHREVLIQTRTECVLAKVSYSQLWSALKNELQDYAVEFLKLIGEKLSMRVLKSNRKVLTLSSLDVEGRIARALIDLTREPDALSHPLGTQIKITRDELSRHVGCSRELASRTLKSLQERGMILMERRIIIVLDDHYIQKRLIQK